MRKGCTMFYNIWRGVFDSFGFIFPQREEILEKAPTEADDSVVINMANCSRRPATPLAASQLSARLLQVHASYGGGSVSFAPLRNTIANSYFDEGEMCAALSSFLDPDGVNPDVDQISFTRAVDYYLRLRAHINTGRKQAARNYGLAARLFHTWDTLVRSKTIEQSALIKRLEDSGYRHREVIKSMTSFLRREVMNPVVDRTRFVKAVNRSLLVRSRNVGEYRFQELKPSIESTTAKLVQTYDVLADDGDVRYGALMNAVLGMDLLEDEMVDTMERLVGPDKRKGRKTHVELTTFNKAVLFCITQSSGRTHGFVCHDEVGSVDRLKHQQRRYRNHIGRLLKRQETLVTEIATLSKENHELRAKVDGREDAMRNEIKRLNRENFDLNAKLARVEEEFACEKEALVGAKREMQAKLDRQVGTFQGELTALYERNDALMDKLRRAMERDGWESSLDQIDGVSCV